MKEFVSLHVVYSTNTIYLIHNYLSIPNKAIGQVFFELGYNNKANDIKLTLLKIDEPFQSIGLGNYFILKIIEYFKDVSLDKIHVLAAPFGSSKKQLNMKLLIEFYKKLGFKESEIQNHNTNLNREMYYQYPKSF